MFNQVNGKMWGRERKKQQCHQLSRVETYTRPNCLGLICTTPTPKKQYPKKKQELRSSGSSPMRLNKAALRPHKQKTPTLLNILSPTLLPKHLLKTISLAIFSRECKRKVYGSLMFTVHIFHRLGCENVQFNQFSFLPIEEEGPVQVNYTLPHFIMYSQSKCYFCQGWLYFISVW